MPITQDAKIITASVNQIMTPTTSSLANEPARRAASQQTRWMNQDVEYDFTADLTGTGDRSEYEKNM